MNSHGSWMFKVVPFFIAFCFLAIVAYWVAIGVFGYVVAQEVKTEGLKGVVNQVWCGEKDCK